MPINFLGRKPLAPSAPKNNSESPFVLAKLGYELRQTYDEVMQEPIPEEMMRTLKQMPEVPALRYIDGGSRRSDDFVEPTVEAPLLLPFEKPFF
jgi:hypothetical protein